MDSSRSHAAKSCGRFCTETSREVSCEEVEAASVAAPAKMAIPIMLAVRKAAVRIAQSTFRSIFTRTGFLSDLQPSVARVYPCLRHALRENKYSPDFTPPFRPASSNRGCLHFNPPTPQILPFQTWVRSRSIAGVTRRTMDSNEVVHAGRMAAFMCSLSSWKRIREPRKAPQLHSDCQVLALHVSCRNQLRLRVASDLH